MQSCRVLVYSVLELNHARRHAVACSIAIASARQAAQKHGQGRSESERLTDW